MVLTAATIGLEVLTLFVLALSVALLSKQKGSYFKPIQPLLITAYVLFITSIVSEVLNFVLQTWDAAFWNALIWPTSIILSAGALTTCAVAISERPSVFWKYLGLNVKGSVSWPLFLYTVYLAALLATLWVVQPFELTFVTTLFGSSSLVARFAYWYGFGVLVALLVFVAYPCRLMIIRSRMVRSPTASKALLLIAVSWIVAAVVHLGLRIPFRYWGVDAREVTNLLASGIFSITAFFFRQTSVLESFFDVYTTQVPRVVHGPRFSERLGISSSQIFGKKVLLEFDPSSSYENLVKDFVYESLSRSTLPLVITRLGSPLYSVLTDDLQVRFLCLTHSVSYPTQGSSDREILLPEKDLSIILGAVDKAFRAQSQGKLSVVIDSLSDMVITCGIEKTYRFVTDWLELLSTPNTTELFLLNPGAHDPKIVSMFRGLFPTLIIQREEGLKVVKLP